MTFSRDRWHNKATATCNIKSLLEDSTMRRRPHLERPQWMESAYALKLSNKTSTALSEESLSKESKGSRCETMELEAQDLSKGKSCIVEVVACHPLPKNQKALEPMSPLCSSLRKSVFSRPELTHPYQLICPVIHPHLSFLCSFSPDVCFLTSGCLQVLPLSVFLACFVFTVLHLRAYSAGPSLTHKPSVCSSSSLYYTCIECDQCGHSVHLIWEGYIIWLLNSDSCHESTACPSTWLLTR